MCNKPYPPCYPNTPKSFYNSQSIHEEAIKIYFQNLKNKGFGKPNILAYKPELSIGSDSLTKNSLSRIRFDLN